MARLTHLVKTDDGHVRRAGWPGAIARGARVKILFENVEFGTVKSLMLMARRADGGTDEWYGVAVDGARGNYIHGSALEVVTS